MLWKTYIFSWFCWLCQFYDRTILESTRSYWAMVQACPATHQVDVMDTSRNDTEEFNQLQSIGSMMGSSKNTVWKLPACFLCDGHCHIQADGGITSHGHYGSIKEWHWEVSPITVHWIHDGKLQSPSQLQVQFVLRLHTKFHCRIHMGDDPQHQQWVCLSCLVL